MMTWFCLMFCHQRCQHAFLCEARGMEPGASQWAATRPGARFFLPGRRRMKEWWCGGIAVLDLFSSSIWDEIFGCNVFGPSESYHKNTDAQCISHSRTHPWHPLTPFALLRGVSKSGAREQNADSITLDLFGEQKTRAASTRPIKAHQGPTPVRPVRDRAAMAAVGVNHPAPLNVDLKTPVDVAW